VWEVRPQLELRFYKPSYLANCRIAIDDSMAAIASNADGSSVSQDGAQM
jgi:hypothetical protein